MFRFRRHPAQADVVAVPRADLEQLNEELARLRLERHRTLNLAEVGRTARAVAEAAVDSDEAWHAVTEAQALRASLLGVLRDLQIAAGQLERQLQTATPAAEVDRRVAPDRRRMRNATEDHPDRRQQLTNPDLEKELTMIVSP